MSGTSQQAAAWCLALLTAVPALAQRHPESDQPNLHFRDEPGVPTAPPWKKRPPFVRGPLDRYERGRTRRFLGSATGPPYTNYAHRKYIFYLTERDESGGLSLRYRNVSWDRIGTYMGPSYQRVFAIEETRGNRPGAGSSLIDHRTRGIGGRPASLLRELRIGHYAYKKLHWTVTAGYDVRTHFTPLTLGRSHMSIARIDLNHAERDLATLFYSRGATVGTSVLFSTWTRNPPGDFTFDDSPVLLYGGRWQRNTGEYGRFGATFVNQLMQFPATPRSDGLRGDLPYEMIGPRRIRVVAADDSPLEQRANGMVHGVHVVLTGARDGEPVRLSSDPADPDFDAALEPAVTGGLQSGDGREAVGRETVVYEFPVPSGLTVHSARFAADVSGDYRLGVGQSHDFPLIDRSGNEKLEEQTWPAPFAPNEGATRRPFKWYIEADETPWFTVSRSPGSSPTAGNRRLVSFDYGMPTGQVLASVDWRFDLVGLQVSGEMARNLRHFIYPVGANRGKRHRETALAWWMKGRRELADRFALGIELFRMEPDYAGGYDSWRGGLPFHVDRVSSGRVRSHTQEFPLLEDNDDNDQWPDDHPNEVPTAGDSYPGWPNSRVYPGLDDNHDNIPDPDRNENFIPDWEEPFIMYDAEPTDFVYGVDLNNNSVPDYRENDDRPDFPYPRDQKGNHVFVVFENLGLEGSALSVGRYDTRQLVGGGRSRSTYLRYGYRADKPGVGFALFHWDLKRVEDDIEDHTYVHVIPPEDVDVISWINQPDGPPWSPGLHRPATPDSLFMRDSWVSTGYAQTVYRGLGGFEVENSALWMRNARAEILEPETEVLMQPEDVRSRFALVNKIGGAWERRALTLQARFKHRLRYASAGGAVRTSSSDFIPIATARFRLTEHTHLLAGVQGIPLLPFKHWDRVRPDGTYTQTDYVAMIRLRSDYFAVADNNFFFGIKQTHRRYSRFMERDRRVSTMFVELITPL